MRNLLVVLALLLGGNAAFATSVTIELPGSAAPAVAKVSYSCDGGGRVAATYINTPANQFAVLDLGDATVVTVSVLAGSGARYAGQHYEWWTKGDEATLTDLTQVPQQPVSCKASGAGN